MKPDGEAIKQPGLIHISPALKSVQEMMPMDPADRARLKASIQEHGIRDPLKGYYDRKEKKFFLLSGLNRLEIARELGLATVNIELFEFETEAEREAFAISENLDRRHLSQEQKANLVRYLLKADPSQSDRAIAKKAGVSDKTTGRVRGKMVAGAEIPHVEERAGRDGKTYAKKATKKKSAPKPRTLTTREKNKLEKLQKEIKTLELEAHKLETLARTKRAEASKLQRQADQIGQPRLM